jgi:O-antigen ligase
VCVDRPALNKLLRGWRLTLIITAIAGVLGEMGVQALAATNAEERQTGFFGHPNELGGLLATGLPLLILGLPWADGERKGTPLLTRLGLLGLVGFAMATTGSISAFMAAIVATGVTMGILVFGKRERRRVRRSTPLITIAITGVLCVGALWLATSDLPLVDRLTRFSEGNSSVNSSVASRSSLNEFVINHIDEVLVVGIGLDKGSLDEAIQNGRSDTAPLTDHASVIHNIHLRVLFESGLPALVGLWILIAVGFRQGRKLVAYTREDDELRPIAIALFSSMMATNVFALFQPILFHRYYWLPVALTSALWALVRAESHQRQLVEVAERAPRPLPVLPSHDDDLPPIEL